MKKKLIIFTTRKLSNSPRVIREIQLLEKDFTIIFIGISNSSLFTINFLSYLSFKKSYLEKFVSLFSRVFHFWIWPNKYISSQFNKIDNLFSEFNPDLVISHEPFFLTHLVPLKRKYNFKLVFNAHEFHPLEFSDNFFWRYFEGAYFNAIYKKFLPSVDLLVNVCESISEKCFEDYGVSGIVIPNASRYHDIKVFKNKEKVFKIIHHGACIPNRKIEDMISIASLLGDNYELDLMLTNCGSKYFENIKNIVDKVSNVNIIPPVEFDYIVPFTNKYDFGLFLLPPVNFNYSVALPNKFFEFIQARLCVIIGPSVEMKKYIDIYKVGLCSSDFSIVSIVELIRGLSKDDVSFYKYNSDSVAFDLSSESFNKKYLKSINSLFLCVV